MRFLYATAILAALSASVQAFPNGSPVCKSDDATLQAIGKNGSMGKQADATAFAKTWSFQVWDENSKAVTGSLMTNMQYTVTVNGGAYNGVFVYPMFDGKRMDVASETKAFMLEPASNDFSVAAKCAKTDGATITHTNANSKDAKAVVAKFMMMDTGNSKQVMMSGVVVTAKQTFGKAVTPQFNIMQGTGNGGNNGTDTGNGGGNGGDNTGNGGDNGGTTTGGDGTTGGNNTDTTGTNSASFVRPAIALQLIALAAFLLA